MGRLRILRRGERHPAWGHFIDADFWPDAPRPGPRADFANNYPDLVENGYEVVAIRPGSKRPTLPRWSEGHPPETYLAMGQGGWGTGIMARFTPAVDIDIPHRGLVRLLVGMADTMLGRAPVRFGARPKALMPYRSGDEPFAKLATSPFALPDEYYGAEDYKPHKVEILGNGQQFVAYAIHPDTKRPCRWCRGSRWQSRDPRCRCSPPPRPRVR